MIWIVGSIGRLLSWLGRIVKCTRLLLWYSLTPRGCLRVARATVWQLATLSCRSIASSKRLDPLISCLSNYRFEWFIQSGALLWNWWFGLWNNWCMIRFRWRPIVGRCVCISCYWVYGISTLSCLTATSIVFTVHPNSSGTCWLVRFTNALRLLKLSW